SISRRGRSEAVTADTRSSAKLTAEAGAPLLPEPPGRGWLSPLNRRRWDNFRANRRGYWSLWIFLLLFFVSMFSEVIANSRPLIVKFDGGYYFPVVTDYPETVFGGEFETAADYRDPFVQDLINDSGGW